VLFPTRGGWLGDRYRRHRWRPRRHGHGPVHRYILDKTHSYELLFAICASTYLLALLIIHLLTPRLKTVAI